MDVVKKDNPADNADMGSNDNSNNQPLDLASCTLEQFDAEIISGNNRKLRDEYLSLPDDDPVAVRINTLLDNRANGTDDGAENTGDDPAQQGDATGGDAEKPNADGQPPASEGDSDEFVEVKSLKVRKSLIEKYLPNRTPDEAAAELIKASGYQEGTIQGLKERNDGLATKTLSLRDQLDAERKAKEAAERRATELAQLKHEAETTVEEFDFNEDEDIDLYDPDQQERALSLLRKAKKTIDDLKSGKAKQQPPEGNSPSAPQQGKKPPVDSERIKDLRDIATQREYNEIADLQSDVPELRMDVPFQKVDEQVYNFRVGVMKTLGVESWSEAANAYYADNPQGNQLRETCKLRGVQPPADIETWEKIIDVRKERIKNIEDRAKVEGKNQYEVAPLPYNTYRDIYKRNRPATVDLGALKRKADIDAQIANSKSQNSRQTVPEPQSNENSRFTDVNTTPDEQLSFLAKKLAADPNSLSTEECKQIVAFAVRTGDEEVLPEVVLRKSKG